MKQQCHDSESGRFDTGGNPVMVRVCYCGTTACTNLKSNLYPLPKDWKNVRDEETELSEDEENRFYERAFKTNNL